jgi:transposase
MEKTEIKQNVGTDIAKDDFKVCCLIRTESGTIKTRGGRTFGNGLGGFKEFPEWLKNKRYSPEDLNITMEATGVYYEGPAYFPCGKPDFKVHAVFPNRTKKYGQSLGEKSKTDRTDARILARTGLERTLRLWQPVSGNLPGLKQLTRERDSLTGNRTTASNRQHAFSHRGSPNKRSIARTKQQIKILDRQVKEVEKEIKLLADWDEVLKKKFEYVTGIPGVGLITAATVVSGTSGFANITGIKQLSGYAGMDVKIAESGK